MNIDSFLLLLFLSVWDRCHDRVLLFLVTYIFRFVVVTHVLGELLRWTTFELSDLVALQSCLELKLSPLFSRLHWLCLCFEEGEELAFFLCSNYRIRRMIGLLLT